MIIATTTMINNTDIRKLLKNLREQDFNFEPRGHILIVSPPDKGEKYYFVPRLSAIKCLKSYARKHGANI